MAHTQKHDLDGADHQNVIIVDLADGQVLSWNEGDGAWENIDMTGGPGGSSPDVAEDSSVVVSAPDTIDFRHGIDVTDPGGGAVRIAVDESELSHATLGDLTTGDPHTQYALEADAVMDGDSAGGDLSGTYPSPSVVDDSHSHNHDTTITGVSANDHHNQAHDQGDHNSAETGDLVAVAATADAGTSVEVPNADHRHAHGTGYVGAHSDAVNDGDAAGGDLSGTYPNPSVVDDSHNHTGSTIGAVNYAAIAKKLVEA